MSRTEMYAGFCQDFGPTNIALIMRLCRCSPRPRDITAAALSLERPLAARLYCIFSCSALASDDCTAQSWTLSLLPPFALTPTQ